MEEIVVKHVTIDNNGVSCQIACIATFVNGKCSKVIVTDLKNIEDYVERR